MIRTPHRATAALAGVLIGLTTAFVAAAPAAATESTPLIAVKGTAECDPAAGQWTVRWTVTNARDQTATVEKLATEPAAVPGLSNGYVIPRKLASGKPGQVVFTQVLPGGTPSASVSFTANAREAKERLADTVTLGTCAPAETPCTEAADARFHHEFAVSGDRATATVSLDEGVKLCDPEPVTLVSYFAPRPEFATPQFVFAQQSATLTNDQRRVELAVLLPACHTQVDLFFGDGDDVIEEITEDGPRYGDRKLGSKAGPGARSHGPRGWHNGGSSGCRQPDVASVSQCDGTVDVTLSNTGEISRYPVEFTVTAGDFRRTVTVAPNQGESVRVPAGSGDITVTADGMPAQTIRWERPEDCPPPTVVVRGDCETVTVTVRNPDGVTPATAEVTYADRTGSVTVAAGESAAVTFPAAPANTVTVAFPGLGVEPVEATLETRDCAVPGDGAGGGLPVTGAAAGGIAAGAAVLLAIGAALFLIARRRRTTFLV